MSTPGFTDSLDRETIAGFARLSSRSKASMDCSIRAIDHPFAGDGVASHCPRGRCHRPGFLVLASCPLQ
jgi:hypothetical protein